MLTARINGNIQTIEARHYKPQFGGVILCADPCCNAEMIFIPARSEQGGLYIPAHFRSKKRSDHRENCPALKYEENDFEDSVPIDAALQNNWPLLLNLNDYEAEWGLPKGMVQPFRTRREVRGLDTPLNAFKQANRNPKTDAREYAPYSITSIQTLSRFLGKIEKDGLKSTSQKISASWQQRIKSFDGFWLDKSSLIIDEFWHLHARSKDKSHPYSSRYKGIDYACGFPKLFRFVPAMTTKDDPLSRANSTRMETKCPETGTEILLLNRLDFSRAAHAIDRGALLTRDAMVLAVPRVSSTLLGNATEKFNRGKSSVAWGFIDWMVIGSHQIMPAQDFCTEVKPHRKPQALLI